MFNLNNISKAASILIAIGAIFGAVLAIDERYAHAVDLDKYQMSQQIEFKNQRIQYLEDKLFELESKTNKTQYDYALIERYKRQLEELKDRK